MVGWIFVALAGLAIAVVLSVAASNLSTQPIGLSNEPLRAGDRLAPPTVRHTQTPKKAKRRVQRRTQSQTATATATAPTPAVTTTTPAPTTTDTDDHAATSSSGSGSSRTDDRNGRRDSDD
jgi:cytoskeletal protein RodZ